MTQQQGNTLSNDNVVSFDDEPLILVDSNDNVLGYDSKGACHDGNGKLHRAFSIFLFNSAGQLMLQKRSVQKRLWPGYWSNSCCSHPRKGETDLAAAERRIEEELGVTPKLQYLFRFEYQADFGELGAEHELCSIYIAKSDGPISVNVNEVDDWKFIDVVELERELENNPSDYSPWLKLEWPRIRAQHWDTVAALID